MTSTLKKVLIISGPTGIGKTRFSIELAKRINGEIISADSIQIFQKLNVSSNKVEESEMEGIPHHLIDLINPNDFFSCGEFFTKATSIINEILHRGNIPLVVGGSRFYIQSLINGVIGPPSCWELREKLEVELRQKGWSEAFEELRSVDEEYATSLSKNDWYRLTRALEMYKTSSLTPTEWKKKRQQPTNFDFRSVFLYNPDRFSHCRHLDLRCETIVKNGLLKEALELIVLKQKKLEDPTVVSSSNNALLDGSIAKSFSFKYAIDFLENSFINSDDQNQCDHFLHFLSKYQKHTRNFSRKQFQWLMTSSNFLRINYPLPGDQHENEKIEDALTITKDFYFLNSSDAIDLLASQITKVHSLALMRTYQSQLKIFKNPSTIMTLLNKLRKHYEALKKQ